MRSKWEGEGLRPRRTKHRKNGLAHAVEIAKHVIVPESYDDPTIRLEDARAFGVPYFLIHVLTAIEFDDQARLKAGEVGEIAIDGDLAAELEAVQLAIADGGPEPVFGVGGRLSQFTSARGSTLEILSLHTVKLRGHLNRSKRPAA